MCGIIGVFTGNVTAEELVEGLTRLEYRGYDSWGIGLLTADAWLRLPDVSILGPLISILPLQLLAYELSILRGNDPDRPRNLAKSVTVA